MLYLCEYERPENRSTMTVDFEDYFEGPWPPPVALMEWIFDVGMADYASWSVEDRPEQIVSVSEFRPKALRPDGFRAPPLTELIGSYSIKADRPLSEPVAPDVGRMDAVALAAEVERLRIENSAHWDEILALRERLRVVESKHA